MALVKCIRCGFKFISGTRQNCITGIDYSQNPTGYCMSWNDGWNYCQKSAQPCPTADDHDFGGCLNGGGL